MELATQINQDNFTSTYSPEDNKLRFYAVDRLDAELFAQARELGFSWAPRQKLFVTGRWTPQREDFCLLLSGSIDAEQSTMIDRAEAKIERIQTIQDNAEDRANGYTLAAANVGERFASGQPILIGHHSERKARNDQKKMHNALDNAQKEREKIEYYNWKAAGVAHHANYKSNDRSRFNRIKTLLAELRDMQRTINETERKSKFWYRMSVLNDAETQTKNVGWELNYGRYTFGLWGDHNDGKVTTKEVIDRCLKVYSSEANIAHRQRWIMHILNRLGYEQNEQGSTDIFEGELTAAIIQTFCRTHGADKPKAIKEDDFWIVETLTSLPLHIGQGCILSLEGNEWRELMQSVGYTVPAKREAKKQLPLLNFKAKTILLKIHWTGAKEYEQIEMTKAEYKNKYGSEIRKSPCGQFRVRTTFQSIKGSSFGGEYVAVFITDTKEHDAPEMEKEVA